MSEQRRIAVFGGRGYLGRELIEKLKNDPRAGAILEIDQQNEMTWAEDGGVLHFKGNMLDPRAELSKFFHCNSVDTVVLLAWWFNPTHKLKEQWRVNVDGTKNVVGACLDAGVKYIFYAGSSTAYGQLDDPREESLDEDDWPRRSDLRLNAAYAYARQKANVDLFFQCLQRYVSRSRPDFRAGWMRGSIVAGKNTRNVVTEVAKAFGPFMFRARGCDPLMQFISERDMAEVLYLATMEKWVGPVNVAGTGTIRYSEVIKLLGKKEIVLPFWLLYVFCWLGWNIRIGERSLLPFPPTILHLVSKPWVGKIRRLLREFKFKPQDSSTDAIRELSDGLLVKHGK